MSYSIATKTLLRNFKAKGYRLTRVRERVVDILLQASCPLSVHDILGALRKKHLAPNKTTVYREVTFLKERGVLHELTFGERKKYYELALGGHHHHVVCLRCGHIEDVTLKADLSFEEERIAAKTGFHTLSHSLEFFGICTDCNH